MEGIKKGIVAFSCILLMVSAVCFWKGFDYKNNYYQSEKYSSINKHVYVGGDAYNYIINSNYFTGFMVLGSSAALGAIMLICISLNLRSKDRLMDGLKAIYDKIEMPKERSLTTDIAMADSEVSTDHEQSV